MPWVRSGALVAFAGLLGNVRVGVIVRLLAIGILIFLLISTIGQFSGYETIFLISRTILTDAWRVPGGMGCRQIQFRDTFHNDRDSLVRNFETEWDRRFSSSEVVRFREDYLIQCRGTEKRMSAVLSSGRLTSPGLGLASNTNFALTIFLLSNLSTVQRNFQLFIVDWNYVSWSALFEDFTAESSCPIVQTMDASAFQSLNQSAHSLNFLLDEGVKVEAGEAPHLLRELNTEGYHAFFNSVLRLEWTWGREDTFRRKSLLARAFLKLHPDLKKVVKTIWIQLTESGGGGYSAVHIRRGDKTGNLESVNFPILLYFRALRRLCHIHPGRCSRTVYMFCDDAEVCMEFKALAKNCFHVTDFQQNVAQGQILPFHNRSAVAFKTQTQFNKLPAADRLASAQEMLISIYLAALSDFFVCTYSSNICRLVALLKNGTIADVDILSLDWINWTVA